MEVHPLIAPVIDLVFPPRCPLCGAGLAAQAGLCTACWSALVIPGDPACSRCNRPLGAGAGAGAGMVCAPCLAAPPPHAGIASATLYNDASRKLVLAFKHGGRIALAPLLARLMHAQLPAAIGPDWLAVPVPLHRWRLWSRGFNQSALLARELAKLAGVRVGVDALIRRKRTPMLGGLGRAARASAMAGAFAPGKGWEQRLNGAKVLLVDDVLTSGATTEACLAVLRRAGAERVMITCFARVLDEALDHG